MRSLILALALLPLAPPAHAGPFARLFPPQEPASDEGDQESEGPFADLPAFDEAIEGTEAIDGLFTFHRNAETGQVLLEIGPDQLDRDYILSATMDRAVGQAGLYGAIMLENYLFRLHRVGDRIQLVRRNTSFRADPGSPEARAVERSFSDAVLSSAALAAQPHPETGAWLVDLGELLTSGDLHAFNRWLDMAGLGNFQVDGDNSAITHVAAFPRNAELTVSLRLVGDPYQDEVALPDSRTMQIGLRYSLLALPEDGYVTRRTDDRVGHFLDLWLNYSQMGPKPPYERVISRFRLEKKDPAAELSEPVEPIVFWIENSVPVEYREAMAEGIEMWNKAFEAAGFKNAIVARVQPDDADWDPADARYNTVRWFSAYDAAFAIGPSHVDPRTGEIVDADIAFSDGLIRFGAFRKHHFYVDPVSGIRSLGEALTARPDAASCQLASLAAAQAAFAHAVMAMRPGWSSEDEKAFVHQYIAEVTAHEVGHTLGLRHNFAGSTVLGLEQLVDWQLDQGWVAASVMDYNPPVIADEGARQGPWYNREVGPYDVLAIRYAYTPFPDAETEAAELEKLARQAVQDPLTPYGTDEDAGFTGPAMDPRMTRYDFAADPLAWAARDLDLAARLWSRLDEVVPEGASWVDYREAFDAGWAPYMVGSLVAAKHVGGVIHSRAHKGDPGGAPPFTAVPAARQREALRLLTDRIWAASTWEVPPEVMRHLQVEREVDLEWSLFMVDRLDYPLVDAVRELHRFSLQVLFDPSRLGRLVDQAAWSEDPFTLAELFSTVHDGVWSELRGARSIAAVRRNLQDLHLDLLIAMALGRTGAPHDAQALAHEELVRLAREVRGAVGRMTDPTSRAHLRQAADRIEQALQARIVTDGPWGLDF